MNVSVDSPAAPIRKFLEENIMNLDDDDIILEDDTDIFKKGLVNSLFAMRLLNFIEDKFGVMVPDEDIALKNFRTINAMESLVNRLRDAG
ncbi:acyl carrier protein [Aliikangiella maris]|uniref:Phosphopantetheine-binding protein n=2 Tax=Aliikangiella maris TaxID=3162458 RepID=A0ABV3MKX3_9GAMM